jgi:pSer/pThr/pTyr-binding forkhead associated (FHA) protein
LPTDTDVQGAPDAPKRAFIRVLGGALCGGVFQIDSDPIVIGSAADVSVSLPDPLAGDRHAGIRYQQGTWQVHDLTGGGLMVNDIPTSTRTLSGGEILMIGSTELQFCLIDPRRRSADAASIEQESPQGQGESVVVLELVVEQGDHRDRGRKIDILNDSVMTLGRAAQADLSLHDCLSSRRHCRIQGGSSGVEITDLQSLNGTHLEGSLIDTAALRPGDLILIGKTAIRCLKPMTRGD